MALDFLVPKFYLSCSKNRVECLQASLPVAAAQREPFPARLTDVKFTGINVIRGRSNGSLATAAGMSLFKKAVRLAVPRQGAAGVCQAEAR